MGVMEYGEMAVELVEEEELSGFIMRRVNVENTSVRPVLCVVYFQNQTNFCCVGEGGSSPGDPVPNPQLGT